MSNIYDTMKEDLRLYSSNQIGRSVGAFKGMNYKKKVPLVELIEYKISNENTRFKLYVGITDMIKESINIRFPYINLESISIQWTAEEIIQECLRQHDEFVETVNKLDKVTASVPERLRNV